MSSSGFLDKMLAANHQVAEVQSALDTAFGADAAQVSGIIRISKQSVVLRGTFRGQDSVFKRFFKGNAGRTVKAMRREIAYLTTHLLDARFCVNPCLATLPECGLAVLGFVPGLRVSRLLKQARPPRRATVLALAGGWLASTAALRAEVKPFDAPRFTAPLASLATTHLSPPDQMLAAQLAATLSRQAGALHGQPVPCAIAHSDFAPVNLHCHAGRLYAVDIQRAHSFPLARLSARFLVAKDLYSPRRGPQHYGLHAPDLAAFDPTHGLTDAATPALFRLFVGEQMLDRFVSTYRDDVKTPAARARLHGYLSDLSDKDTA